MSEDSDQTARMLRLIRVFTGRTSLIVGLSYTCSFFIPTSPQIHMLWHSLEALLISTATSELVEK